MGYTHYWYRKLDIPRGKFASMREDFAKIVLHLDSLGVHLADGMGAGVPVLTGSEIRFNGLEKCGHAENSDVMIPWPSANAVGVLDGQPAAISGAWFAGALLQARCCNGDCSYETFDFPRCMGRSEDGFLQKSERGHFNSCKTAYRPYDLAVTAFLVIAKHHLSADIHVSSDGKLCHWAEAIEMCRTYLSYPEFYAFDSDGGLIPLDSMPSDPVAAECGAELERCQHRAKKHFPELQGSASGELPMRIYLNGYKPEDLNEGRATGFIIGETRYEAGGSGGDADFGRSWGYWNGLKHRGHSLWMRTLKPVEGEMYKGTVVRLPIYCRNVGKARLTACRLGAPLQQYPVAVKYAKGKKPYPGVAWVFPPTLNNPQETIVQGASR